MVDSNNVVRPTKRERSPNSPGIDVGAAIKRARTFFEAERRNAAPPDAALEHWGYRPKTGAGLRVLATLKQFGLMTDEGSGDTRQVKLSPLGLRIILDERPDSPDREVAIREAALAPRVYKQIWDKYEGSLPSDINLRHELVNYRGFTTEGAIDFIKHFRKTVAFANLSESGNIAPELEDTETPEDDTEMDSTAATADRSTTPQPLADRPGSGAPSTGAMTIPIPLSDGTIGTVTVPVGMTETDWQRLDAILSAYRPLPHKTPTGEEANPQD